MATIGVLLSGCGVYDGSEIHEAVLALLALDRAGAEIVCMAPEMEFEVVDHRRGEPTGERRNVLVESARIARGEIRDLATVTAAELDGLILPGGFGAAKNLSDFAVNGPAATVRPDVERLLRELAAAGKPIGAICIAPATVVRALADREPEVTVGNDVGTAAAIVRMGGRHHVRTVDQIWVDEKNRLVTTPAYMLGPGIKEVAAGIEKLVLEVVRLAGRPHPRRDAGMR